MASLGFKCLPYYFEEHLLDSSKVVFVSTVPVPPLSALGLGRFAEIEQMNPAGITYLDTYFLRTDNF